MADGSEPRETQDTSLQRHPYSSNRVVQHPVPSDDPNRFYENGGLVAAMEEQSLVGPQEELWHRALRTTGRVVGGRVA